MSTAMQTLPDVSDPFYPILAFVAVAACYRVSFVVRFFLGWNKARKHLSARQFYFIIGGNLLGSAVMLGLLFVPYKMDTVRFGINQLAAASPTMSVVAWVSLWVHAITALLVVPATVLVYLRERHFHKKFLRVFTV